MTMPNATPQLAEPCHAHLNNARALLGPDVLASTEDGDLYALLSRVRDRLDAAAAILDRIRKEL